MSNILAAAIEMEVAEEAKAKAISIESILKQIASHTFGCMVAGGYCRDKFYGVEHKDIDIIIYNFHKGDYAENRLMEMLLSWLRNNVAARDITQHGDSQYEQEDRIEFVLHLPHHNVDIICWNAKTHTEVLSRFDCNLNQFYLPSTVPSFDSELPYTPDMNEQPVHAFDGTSELHLLEFLKELHPDRELKMMEKHKRFYPAEWVDGEPVIWFTKTTYGASEPDKSDIPW